MRAPAVGVHLGLSIALGDIDTSRLEPRGGPEAPRRVLALEAEAAPEREIGGEGRRARVAEAVGVVHAHLPLEPLVQRQSFLWCRRRTLTGDGGPPRLLAPGRFMP